MEMVGDDRKMPALRSVRRWNGPYLFLAWLIPTRSGWLAQRSAAGFRIARIARLVATGGCRLTKIIYLHPSNGHGRLQIAAEKWLFRELM
jgi:hypothetical protein